MSIIKTTLLSHIFNEEYLLPFWLNHHKNMFDQIIIIDYNSTDKSIEICKSICPECQIIKTINKDFGAVNVDIEVMDIENKIDGIKIVLNTTEFLFCVKSVKDIFSDKKNKAHAITCITPYSSNSYNINNLNELFTNLLNDDIVYHYDRGIRIIHTFPNGNYTTGRHSTLNNCSITDDAFILWFGYYPMNDNLLKRKLQIKQNVPQGDIDTRAGFQHLFSEDKILQINLEKAKTGRKIENVNIFLHNLLNNL